MAGLEALGNLGHAMETLLERIAANRMQATVASVQALEEGCDRLTVWVEQLQSGQMPEAGNALERFENKVKALSVPPLGEQAWEEQPVEETEPVKPQARTSRSGTSRKRSKNSKNRHGNSTKSRNARPWP